MRVDAAMEKESIENGLQRREECDLGEVEGKRETLSLCFSLCWKRSRSFSGCIGGRKRDDDVDDVDDDHDDATATTTRRENAGGRGEGRGKRETFHESSVTGVQVLVRG